MDQFELVAKMMDVRHLRSPLALPAVMKRVTGLATDGHAQAESRKLENLDWEADLSRFRKWLEREFAETMSDDVTGLWFGVPDVAFNAPTLSSVGSREFHEGADDWMRGICWESSSQYVSVALRRCQTVLTKNFRAGESATSDALFFALPLVYVGYLVRETLWNLPPQLSLGGRTWRCVTVGYASGDVIPLGVVTPAGWAPCGEKYRQYSAPFGR